MFIGFDYIGGERRKKRGREEKRKEGMRRVKKEGGRGNSIYYQ